jgi:hypothetical protein
VSAPSAAGGAFATGAHVQLVRAAVLDGDAGREAWTRWRAGADLDRLDRASERLLPQLALNLQALGVDDPALPLLRETYERHEQANRRLFERAGEAIAALEAAGVPTLVLKGAALAVLHYDGVGARPMTDVDVLVPRERARAAIAVLKRCGFTTTMPTERVLGLAHAAPLADAVGRSLDLHWYSLPQPSRDDALWSAAVPLTLGGASTRALAPADQLFHVCAHGATWDPLPPIRWLVDAAQVLRTDGAALDWSRVVERAQAAWLTVGLAATLSHLRSAIDAPVPDAVLAALHATPTSVIGRWAQREAFEPPPRLRKSASYLLDRRRRLRTLADPDLPPTLGQFVLRARGVDHVWQLPAHAAEKLRLHRRRRSPAPATGRPPA